MRETRQVLDAIETARRRGMLVERPHVAAIPPAAPPDAPAEMAEDQLLRRLLLLAKARNWRTAHFRPARTAKGWRTAVAGDGKGWPDIVAVRGDRIVAFELKSADGRLRPEQRDWLAALSAAGVETHVVRPADLPAIEEILA